jgi:hypothetical protein
MALFNKLFRVQKSKMKYSFSIEWNIHMYNHRITYTCGQNKYVAICESAPTKEKTIIFWPDDFGLPLEEKEAMINNLIEWSKLQGFKCIIGQGKSR